MNPGDFNPSRCNYISGHTGPVVVLRRLHVRPVEFSLGTKGSNLHWRVVKCNQSTTAVSVSLFWLWAPNCSEATAGTAQWRLLKQHPSDGESGSGGGANSAPPSPPIPPPPTTGSPAAGFPHWDHSSASTGSRKSKSKPEIALHWPCTLLAVHAPGQGELRKKQPLGRLGVQ